MEEKITSRPFDILKKEHEVVIPDVLVNKFAEYLNPSASTVLITECERYSEQVLDNILSSHPGIKFTLTTNKFKFATASFIYTNRSNVNILPTNIYDEGFTAEKFDLIISVPVFASTNCSEKGEFISKSSDLIAAQNLLYHLNVGGKLVIVLPAKVAFTKDKSTVSWRNFVETSFNIDEISALPGGFFRPAAGIRTYLFVFSNNIGKEDDIVLKRYETDNSADRGSPKELIEKDSILCFRYEFFKSDGWNIDMAFLTYTATADDDMKKFMDSKIAKKRLGDVASVFRGKAVKEKSETGNIGVINISDITETGIKYSSIKLIKEDELKVMRYFLRDDDVLMTTRGTTLKVAVFEKQPKPCIPSANIIVIRPGKEVRGMYLKLFLESAAGVKMLSSLQRGGVIVNINYEDIKELDVPVPPREVQNALIEEYSSGLKKFIAAKKTWRKTRENIQSKLFCDDFI